MDTYMIILQLFSQSIRDNTQNNRVSSLEINNSCQRILFRDCSTNITTCPIDLQPFRNEDYILKINHCGHIFRESNLRRAFETDSRCPMCRHNIRTEQHIATTRTPIRHPTRNPNRTVIYNPTNVDISGNNISMEYSLSFEEII